MTGTVQEIDVAELVNYFENSRHAIANSEEDTLKKLFEAVGNQYMLNLAEDIQNANCKCKLDTRMNKIYSA